MRRHSAGPRCAPGRVARPGRTPPPSRSGPTVASGLSRRPCNDTTSTRKHHQCNGRPRRPATPARGIAPRRARAASRRATSTGAGSWRDSAAIAVPESPGAVDRSPGQERERRGGLAHVVDLGPRAGIVARGRPRRAARSSVSSASSAYAPSSESSSARCPAVRHRIGHSLTPASISAARSRSSPGADPALHRAFGLFEQDRDLAVRVPAEVRELDRLALAVGERRPARRTVSASVSCIDLTFEVDDRSLGLRNASRFSRARAGADSARSRSTARPCTWASRNERIEPAPGRTDSDRATCARTPLARLSSASVRSSSTRCAEPEARTHVAPVELGQRRLVARRDGAAQIGIGRVAALGLRIVGRPASCSLHEFGASAPSG